MNIKEKTSKPTAVLALFFIAVLSMAISPLFAGIASASSAFDDSATESYSYSDSITGNAFVLNRSVSNTSISNDLYWAGSSIDGEKLEVGSSGIGSALLAGQVVSLKNSTVADSVRAAGYNVSLSGVTAKGNLTLAGNFVSLDAKTQANGVYIAGSELTVNGTYNGGGLLARKVVFNGEVKGDLSIKASEIEIGSGAKIDGKLTVPEGANVTIANGAQVGSTEKTATQTQDVAVGDALSQIALTIVFACLAHIILALLFFWLFRSTMFDAVRMVEEKIGKIMLTGVIVFFVAPIVMILLILPIVTIPVVVLMAIVMITIFMFSIPFAGSILGMRVLKGANPLLASFLAVIVLTILCYVLPFMMFIIPALCSIFTAGYLGQKFLDKRRKEKANPQMNLFNRNTPSANLDQNTPEAK